MTIPDHQSTAPGSRRLTRVVRGTPASDGAGVKLNRVIGTQQVPDIDPFLMLDEFRSDNANDYIAGFPDHPHRGFETVTYMLAGRMRHADNHGHSGLMEAGSVQWMTAGRGIIHSEMPEQENGLMAGFQLWINLPARLKMSAPRYQEFPATAMPLVTPAPGVTVKLIAGELEGRTGPVSGIATQPLYWDISLAAGTDWRAPVPATHQAFIYVFEGGVRAGPADSRHDLQQGQMAVLGQGDHLELQGGNEGARLLLIAGLPLGEPVARYGPFVMNTQQEIHQAFTDYQNGRF
ncbi:MAG: Pirin domain protein [Moraxellaceae bacterium]|jgi:redox-sensitive bicupin YhaK (pirin superfamily)|nr:Pirin domain protein [Moraxellaceae bacterium]